MLLQCSNCAGSVTASDQAIRRGVVMCGYCHTVLRVTKAGIRAYKRRFLNRKPPDNIRIKRNGAETKIVIPTGYQGTIIPGLLGDEQIWIDLIVACIIGWLVWFSIRVFVPFFPTFFCTMLPFFLLARAMFSYKFILLQNGVVKVSHVFSAEVREISVKDIKQLYVTKNRQFGGQESFTEYNLFVLKENGERVRLYGSFSSVEAALYVEEWLEIELDIFNLPVYGELQTRTFDVAAIQKQSDEQMVCYACTALLKITAAVRQRGYLTCGYCHTITLLYTQDSHKPLLGQPDPKKMVYKVAHSEKFAGVVRKKEKKAVLLLTGNKIVRSLNNPSVKGKKIRFFGVRESVSAGDSNSKELIAERYEQVLSYSQDLSLSNASIDMADRIFNTIYYTVIGQIGNRMYPLILNLEDLHEAGFIVSTLNNYLDMLRETTVER